MNGLRARNQDKRCVHRLASNGSCTPRNCSASMASREKEKFFAELYYESSDNQDEGETNVPQDDISTSDKGGPLRQVKRNEDRMTTRSQRPAEESTKKTRNAGQRQPGPGRSQAVKQSTEQVIDLTGSPSPKAAERTGKTASSGKRGTKRAAEAPVDERPAKRSPSVKSIESVSEPAVKQARKTTSQASKRAKAKAPAPLRKGTKAPSIQLSSKPRSPGLLYESASQENYPETSKNKPAKSLQGKAQLKKSATEPDETASPPPLHKRPLPWVPEDRSAKRAKTAKQSAKRATNCQATSEAASQRKATGETSPFTSP